MAGVHKEIWESEVEKKYRGDQTGRHLEGMKDYSSKVSIDKGVIAINLAVIGADPKALVDNTVYPISSSAHDSSQAVLALRKVETENTIITDDELYGISYDAIGVTVEQHTEVLSETNIALTNFVFSPSTHTAETPIFLTTGADRDGSGRKKLTVQDIRRLKVAFNNAKIPLTGRRIVLCAEHIGDLLDENEAFSNQYKNIREGQILRLYGFDVYEELDMATYTGTAGDATTMNREAFGSIPDFSSSRLSSFAYYVRNAWKAMTNNKMYYSKAEDNPKTRENEVGFRKYFCAAPKTQRGFAALVDDDSTV